MILWSHGEIVGTGRQVKTIQNKRKSCGLDKGVCRACIVNSQKGPERLPHVFIQQNP